MDDGECDEIAELLYSQDVKEACTKVHTNGLSPYMVYSKVTPGIVRLVEGLVAYYGDDEVVHQISSNVID